ncbi:two-component sensor histidine kinase [Nocardioides mangrovicus]|uniref:histidine kinase n=1 Tax=Nocardioides mangrovicus TaxID=2478913 RepID=A0A3L8P699_9ACTN|nr:histidine kinase [Nocardioides mangrovicus]RLV50467.1 two-component sensor histidine kinase [Nocardioides mangrovicus]
MIDPARSRTYQYVAGGGAVFLLLLGLGSVWGTGLLRVYPDGSGMYVYQSSDAPAFFCLIAAVVTAAVPLMALRAPRTAFAVGLLLPVWLVWAFSVWSFTSFAGLLVVAVLTMPRSRQEGVAMGVVSMLFPLTLLAKVTMTMPDRNQIYLHFGGAGTGGRLVVIGLYGVLVALVLVAAEMLRRYVASHAEVAEQAATLSERSRLARDLHDVVAHHVSLIAVRAETAPYTVPSLQPEARVALADIADHSRQALDELRGVLGVLRRGEEADGLAPQPSGADVAQLVARAAEVGPVDLDGAEALAALDATRGYVAYRVVQEALTNARRHAPGSAVAITARLDGELLLRVTNRADGVDAVVPGRGLTGMRERVAALGGTLVVEPRGGDVVVEVRLP